MATKSTEKRKDWLSEKKYKKLNSIVVGEDIFKDSITIILFGAILHLEETEDPTKFIFYWYTPFEILLKFLEEIVCSSLIGIIMAIITTFMFKKLRFLMNDDGVS